MDNLQHKTKNTFKVIEDIRIVTKRSKEDHLKTVEETIQVQDEAEIRLKTEKCKIAKTKTEWLGYKLSAENKTYRRKVQAITNRLPSKI